MKAQLIDGKLISAEINLPSINCAFISYYLLVKKLSDED